MKNTKAYDCAACLGFCCQIYERITVTVTDVKRLARHLGIKVKRLVKDFVREDCGQILSRKQDPLLGGETCVFFDTDRRCCGVYEARPQICREWPKPEHRLPGAENRCCYFDLYQFAKRELGPNAAPLVQIGRIVPDWKRKVS